MFAGHDRDNRKGGRLNKAIHTILKAILIMLLGTSLTHCSETAPTTNQVRTIELSALDDMVADKGFRGLVVAMASWCPPCREELPILAKLYRRYKESGVQIVAISLDTKAKDVQPLIDKLKIPFPVYWVGTQAVGHYRIAGVPTTMIYQNGKLIQKLPGSHSESSIEKKIKALMAAKK